MSSSSATSLAVNASLLPAAATPPVVISASTAIRFDEWTRARGGKIGVVFMGRVSPPERIAVCQPRANLLFRFPPTRPLAGGAPPVRPLG